MDIGPNQHLRMPIKGQEGQKTTTTTTACLRRRPTLKTTIRRQVGGARLAAHLTAALLVVLAGWLAAERAVQCQTSGTNDHQTAAAALLAGERANLNDILAHQLALVEQCKRLESAKLAELKQLMAFNRELDADLQLNDRLTLRLPAVCLLLVGPPQFDADQREPRAGQPAPAPRLDLVNWIYERDDLARLVASEPAAANNKTKRQAGAGQQPAGLLSDYWLDLAKLEANASSAKPSDQYELEMLDFHEQTGRLLEDVRFQEAIRSVEGNKIARYLSPVILVPGLAGSRLQAHVEASKPKVNIICSRQAGWQDVWLSLRSFLPVAIDCWIDNVRMEYDPESGFTREAPGVKSRVAHFGSVESVRHLDLKSPSLTQYFHSIIERYERLGYQPDRNLFAAPYDFRLAPQQLKKSFFQPLKKLIEFAHSNERLEPLEPAGANGEPAASRLARPTVGKKVTLVCHSMGCTHLLIFLRRQQAAWRQKRIRKLIALASPWGGTVKALKALLVGEQFGLPLVSETKMRRLARTFPGVAYMVAQPEVFERPNRNELDFGGQVLVQTPERDFRVNDLAELLEAAGAARQWSWFQKTASLIKPLEPLADLSVDCLHGMNIPTPESLIFRNSTDFPDGDYELVLGDGDGTVNHQSLLVCDLWARQLPDRVRHKLVMNINHMGILSHKSTLEHITDDVLTDN